jgi:hypothetical protein
MLIRRWFLAALLSLSLAAPSLGQSAPRVGTLIKQMSSEQFVLRERASGALEALGVTALEPLRQASKSSDRETARRAGELVRHIEEQLLIAEILAPKKVRLQFADATVLTGLAELKRQSGYVVQVSGAVPGGTPRQDAFDSGATTFWQALDRFAARTNLSLPPSPAIAVSNVAVAAPLFVRGRGIRTMTSTVVAPEPEPIRLVAGPPARYVSYAGAVRVELRVAKESNSKEGARYRLILDAAAEPRLLGFTLIGAPTLQSVRDERGETRTLTEAGTKPLPQPGTTISLVAHRQHAFVLHLPEASPARLLKELSGILLARVALTDDALARVNVATLERALGKNGGAMQVNIFEKQANGDFRAQVVLENLGINPFAPNMILLNANAGIQGNVAVMGGVWGRAAPHALDAPDLLDEEGGKYQIGQVTQTSRLNNTQFTRTLTIVYRPRAGQSAPRQFVYHGSRTVLIPVSFLFRDVALD